MVDFFLLAVPSFLPTSSPAANPCLDIIGMDQRPSSVCRTDYRPRAGDGQFDFAAKVAWEGGPVTLISVSPTLTHVGSELPGTTLSRLEENLSCPGLIPFPCTPLRLVQYLTLTLTRSGSFSSFQSLQMRSWTSSQPWNRCWSPKHFPISLPHATFLFQVASKLNKMNFKCLHGK